MRTTSPSTLSDSFGVVGLGCMARALLFPLIDGGLIERSTVRAVVASERSADHLRDRHNLQVSTDPAEAWQAPSVLLAVKPQQLEAVAAAASTYRPSKPGLLLSVVAGVTLARLQSLFPGWSCVRAVPNTPSLVRAGLTALAWEDGIPSARREWVVRLFTQVGEVMELPEAQLDSFLALTSSGPAFLALVAEAMADGAVCVGLPRDLAHHLAHRTMAGTAALLRDQELHPGQLKDMVGSPAGTTMAGLRQLEGAGLRSAMIEAVVAAADRSRQLSG